MATLHLHKPSDTPFQTIERFLGECGVHEPSDELETGSLTCLELLGRVRDWGGVAVAAHVEGSKGILKQLTGHPCISAWTSENLIAVALSSEIAALDDGTTQIVRNLDAAYRRRHPVALIHANDVWDPSHLSDPLATTSLKMTEPTIDGVRHAFLDPESRVQIHTAAVPEKHPAFHVVEISGGFLDGIRITFSPELNVIIGARGSGKSNAR